MTSIIQTIRDKQLKARGPASAMPPPHEPEMLYIGCIDARLDPIDDIGIPKGKALIYRNIGALVPPNPPGNSGVTNPESVSIGAALELFLSMPAVEGRVKHIVVSGHTHCGGIHHACAHHHEAQQDGFLARYLSLLTGALETIFGPDVDAGNHKAMRRLEEESVRRSVKNLESYPAVAKALQAEPPTVELHGWVIDTATQRIREMGEKKQFKQMANIPPPPSFGSR